MGSGKGFIALDRVMQESWVWELSPTDFKVTVTCLFLANWEDRQWFDGRQVVTIRRGSFISSMEKIAEKSGKGITRKIVRGALKRLVAAEFLELGTSKGQPYTVVNVVNYDKYQKVEQNEGPASGQERANDGPGAGQRRATTEPFNHSTTEPNNQISLLDQGPSAPPSPSAAETLATTAVEAINRLTGSSYKANSKGTLDLCRKLAKDGYTVEQVEAVVASKYAEWGRDPSMQKRVCPPTLLALSNFRKYIEAVEAAPEDYRKPRSEVARNYQPTKSDLFGNGETKI